MPEGGRFANPTVGREGHGIHGQNDGETDMTHIPNFIKRWNHPQKVEYQDPEPRVTLDAIKSLSDEFHRKAQQDAKDWFELSLRIDQKISDGVRQVDTRWKWYVGILAVLAVVAVCFAVPQWIRESVTEKFVGEEVQKQIGRFTDENVSAMVKAGVAETEERVKGELENTRKELSGLQGAILAARQETEALSAELQESRELIGAYEQVAAARGGDRTAYDGLRMLAAGDGGTAQVAKQGIDEIGRAYETRKRLATGGPADPPAGDPATPVEEDMMQVYADGEGCEGALWRLAGLGQAEYTATFVRAVAKSKRLDCVYAGILGIEKATGQTFPALGIDEVLAWWKERQDDGRYHHGFESVCGAVRKPGETDESFRWRRARLMKEWIDGEPGRYWCARQLFELLYSLQDGGSANRRIMLQQVLDYLGTEQPLGNAWHVAKTMYLFAYNQLELPGFVNARLAEDPSFENELRQYENQVFPGTFFQPGQINWPSQSPAPQKKALPRRKPRGIDSDGPSGGGAVG